jgi:hypothetical protein
VPLLEATYIGPRNPVCKCILSEEKGALFEAHSSAQKPVDRARAAYDSANRQLQATDQELQAIEDEAVKRTGGSSISIR